MIKAGLVGVGAWFRMLSHCATYLTDGEVDDAVALSIAGKRRVLDRLVAVRLLDRTEAGYRVHNYLKYNPSRAQVEAERASKNERQSRWRSGAKQAHATSETIGESRDVDASTVPSTDASRSASRDASRDSAPLPLPLPLPSHSHTQDKNSLPSGVSSARASAHAHTHEGLALEVEAPKAKRSRVKAAPPVDTVPPEGTAAHRVYSAITRDAALRPIVKGPGDLAERLAALCDGTTVDPVGAVIAAGAWQARERQWTDGASGLLRWVKRDVDKARAMPVAAPPVAQGRAGRLTRDVSRGPLDSAPVGSFEIAPEDEYDWLAPVGAQR